MRGPLALLVALALCVGLAPAADAGAARQDPRDDAAAEVVARLRGEGRFAEALEACADVRDPAAAAEARLLVAWEAGDLGGALHHGLAGLESRPEHLSLLWLTTRLALDLAAADLAPRLHARLASAVATAPDLDPGSRGAWTAEVERLDAPVGALEASAAARGGALRRARVVVLAGVVLLAAFWALLARRT